MHLWHHPTSPAPTHVNTNSTCTGLEWSPVATELERGPELQRPADALLELPPGMTREMIRQLPLDRSGSPNHHCAATSPTTCPNGFHSLLAPRAELDAQRVAASTLPVATQSQDPQEPVTSPPHPLGPEQHPSQHQLPTGMSQQQQPSLQQQSQEALPIAQTLQPPQHYPAQGIGTIFPTTLQGSCC